MTKRSGKAVLVLLIIASAASAQETTVYQPFTLQAARNHAGNAGDVSGASVLQTVARAVPARIDKQGGDDLASAVEIPSLPYADTGATCSHGDDLNVACGPVSSFAHDVVYVFTPDVDFLLTVDLCGSDYDTRLFILDADLNLVACNDDHYEDETCGYYTSYLSDAWLAGGQSHYIVVDGRGLACGDYVLSVTGDAAPPPDCVVECSGSPEAEPDLADGYLDEFNGGCNSPESFYPRQLLAGDGAGDLVFCGRSGWYLNGGGDAMYRDTDWFWTVIGLDGQIQWTLDADQEVFGFMLAPNDCDEFFIDQTIEAGPCAPGSMIISGEIGDTVWLWVGPRTSQIPNGVHGRQFNYVSQFVGLMPAALSVESKKWGAVKSMYR